MIYSFFIIHPRNLNLSMFKTDLRLRLFRLFRHLKLKHFVADVSMAYSLDLLTFPARPGPSRRLFNNADIVETATSAFLKFLTHPTHLPK